MPANKNVLAFVMAGGEGSRLHPLTANRCKPAVPFNGKHRIVDFVLSNLVNSEIYSIYLDPEQWGRGVARELMRTVVAEAGASTRIMLWVLAENERAQHFYRRNGFAPDGVEKLAPVGGAELLEVRYLRG